MKHKIEQARIKAEEQYQEKLRQSRASDVDVRDFFDDEELERILQSNDFFTGKIADYEKMERYNKLRMAAQWMMSHSLEVAATASTDEGNIYLYHLRMIEHLYGLPHDTEGLIANIERFRDEYMRQGMVIDHIDNDCTNDRLSNLMLMSLENNSVKSAIMRAIKKLGYPFYCWAERYDDAAITLQAGYFSQFKRPRYMVEGVFAVQEFLQEAQSFVDCAREECTIYDEFERLKRKEEEKQK